MLREVDVTKIMVLSMTGNQVSGDSEGIPQVLVLGPKVKIA